MWQLPFQIPSLEKEWNLLQVEQLYVTMGVYLGYALAQYCEFYPIDHVMILGRVSKGAGGMVLNAWLDLINPSRSSHTFVLAWR